MVVPQTPHVPRVMGVPPLLNAGCGFSTSRFSLHLTQYASTDFAPIKKDEDPLAEFFEPNPVPSGNRSAGRLKEHPAYPR